MSALPSKADMLIVGIDVWCQKRATKALRLEADRQEP